MELDACTSSDALLMNIFCHPGVARDGKVSALLGVEAGTPPDFGYKARVPLANGKFDRTEVDVRLGNLLIEAKLTESNFQSAEKEVLMAYRDFSEVFDRKQLSQTDDRYLSYQLLRNVLAAYALAPLLGRSRLARQQRDRAARVLSHLGEGVFLVDSTGVWSSNAGGRVVPVTVTRLPAGKRC